VTTAELSSLRFAQFGITIGSTTTGAGGDNGSHTGYASIERIESKWKNARRIRLPIHACWLNQIELYFSIVQRKVLTPNDLDSLEVLTNGWSVSAPTTAESPGRSSGPSLERPGAAPGQDR
jgi:hypothetical protein